jgi:hypothetical protein
MFWLTVLDKLFSRRHEEPTAHLPYGIYVQGFQKNVYRIAKFPLACDIITNATTWHTISVVQVAGQEGQT